MKQRIDYEKLGSKVFCKKNEIILSQNESDTSLFYVEAGLIKAFYITEDGRELVKSFIEEGNVAGSLRCCIRGESSPFTLTCLEDCTLIKIEYGEIKKQMKTDVRLANQVFEVLADFAMKKEQREYEFLCLDAEQRYEKIRQETPQLLNRVKQQDLAKYLGITPVALSRIRGRSAIKV